MTPPRSLDAVRRDDALLDRLAGRLGTEPADDAVAHLLAALADDVDRELPSSVDPVAVAALTAAVASRSRAGRTQSGAVEVAVVHELPRRRRVLAVHRGGAVVAVLAMVLGSAGVAAAVTGDPAGAFGLRTISAVVHGGSQPHATSDRSAPTASARSAATATATATDLLRSRIDAAARRASTVSPSELEALEAQARRLPDGGGPAVQEALARLRAKVALTGSEGTSRGAGPSTSAGTGHHDKDSSHPTRDAATSPAGSSGSRGKKHPTKASTSASSRSVAPSPSATRSSQDGQDGQDGPDRGQGDGKAR